MGGPMPPPPFMGGGPMGMGPPGPPFMGPPGSGGGYPPDGQPPPLLSFSAHVCQGFMAVLPAAACLHRAEDTIPTLHQDRGSGSQLRIHSSAALRSARLQRIIRTNCRQD
jgi:hypothetical protein